jgi:hypothetical protein
LLSAIALPRLPFSLVVAFWALRLISDCRAAARLPPELEVDEELESPETVEDAEGDFEM